MTPIQTSTRFRPEIEVAAGSEYLDADVVESVVIVESSGTADAFRYEDGFYHRYLADNPDPHYVGKIPRRISSSYGLMQVMYSTAVGLGFPYPDPEFLFIPSINLGYGCRELKRLLQWSRNRLPQALAAYNGGKGNWEGEAPQAYAAKVLRYRDAIVATR